jgi:hypothetical protein
MFHSRLPLKPLSVRARARNRQFCPCEVGGARIQNGFIAHEGLNKPTLNYRPDLAKWERWLALELVGPNPFRPITFDPAWRTEVVTTLARIADETAGFGNLPVLADALEEAGCDVPEILTHLRGPGPHVRGCWVVDGLLRGG